jgi:peptidoglycan/xylan/chitin deacetylase (PgdA/CDA1 family)
MYFSTGINGSDLADKTVCLTFDDGPGVTKGGGTGPRTLELARCLAEREIFATFFVIGRSGAAHRRIVEEVEQLGHLIGNHTYAHPFLANQTGRVAYREIKRTDRALSGVTQTLKLFRPPYGSWKSEVAGYLNWTKAWPYVGPIMWDIDAADWQFWRNGGTAEECAAAYISSIERVGRGIMLMHDSSFEADIRSRNETCRAAMFIVDWLVQSGYSFVRLDSVPQVVRAARVRSVVALRTATGQYVSPQGGGGGQVLANAPRVGPWEPLGVVELGDDKIALRCLSGHYLSVQNGGAISADGAAIGAREVLTRADLGKGRIALRCPNGHYFSPQGGGEVLANGPSIAKCEVLRVSTPESRKIWQWV